MIALRTLRRRRGAPMARHANRAGLPRRPLPAWFDTRDLPAVPMRWEDLHEPAPVLTDEQADDLRSWMRADLRAAVLAGHAHRVIRHAVKALADAIARMPAKDHQDRACSTPTPAAAPAEVLAAALPDHGLMRPAQGDAYAQAALAAYQARARELEGADRSHQISARLVGLPQAADLVTRWRKK